MIEIFPNASNNKLLGTSFQKPAGASAFIGVPILIDSEARKGIGFQWYLGSIEHQNLSNADALGGIAKPKRPSVSISLDTPMNAEALVGFAP